jgi:hypothetical protein
MSHYGTRLFMPCQARFEARSCRGRARRSHRQLGEPNDYSFLSTSRVAESNGSWPALSAWIQCSRRFRNAAS